jgi:hypothetical protein
MTSPPDDDRNDSRQATLWIVGGLPVDPHEVRSPYVARSFYQGR